MRLTITTPLTLVLDQVEVTHVRAEDETGAFGILPRHADFMTVVEVSVVTWRDQDGVEHHCAVRGGLLTVKGGDRVAVATRDAVTGDDLKELESTVVGQFRETAREEERARIAEERLQAAAIQQIYRYLRPEEGL